MGCQELAAHDRAANIASRRRSTGSFSVAMRERACSGLSLKCPRCHWASMVTTAGWSPRRVSAERQLIQGHRQREVTDVGADVAGHLLLRLRQGHRSLLRSGLRVAGFVQGSELAVQGRSLHGVLLAHASLQGGLDLLVQRSEPGLPRPVLPLGLLGGLRAALRGPQTRHSGLPPPSSMRWRT